MRILLGPCLEWTTTSTMPRSPSPPGRGGDTYRPSGASLSSSSMPSSFGREHHHRGPPPGFLSSSSSAGNGSERPSSVRRSPPPLGLRGSGGGYYRERESGYGRARSPGDYSYAPPLPPPRGRPRGVFQSRSLHLFSTDILYVMCAILGYRRTPSPPPRHYRPRSRSPPPRRRLPVRSPSPPPLAYRPRSYAPPPPPPPAAAPLAGPSQSPPPRGSPALSSRGAYTPPPLGSPSALEDGEEERPALEPGETPRHRSPSPPPPLPPPSRWAHYEYRRSRSPPPPPPLLRGERREREPLWLPRRDPVRARGAGEPRPMPPPGGPRACKVSDAHSLTHSY